jgi:hypothetical protein
MIAKKISPLSRRVRKEKLFSFLPSKQKRELIAHFPFLSSQQKGKILGVLGVLSKQRERAVDHHIIMDNK